MYEIKLTKKSHILVVDDNIICQKVLCKILDKINCTHDVASNGQIACDMSLKNTYDLIFMDLRMDVMDGLEASDIIINKHKNKTPIIAFSGDGSQDIYDECKNIGIVEFISKPAKQNQIYEIINKFVKFN